MKKVIGIDVGYGCVKVVTKYETEIRQIIFESIVGTCDSVMHVEGLKEANKKIVSVDGENFIVGRGARKHSSRILNGREKNWLETTSFRALLTHAVELAGCNSIDLLIVTGLPVSFFKVDREKLINIVRTVAQPCCLNLAVKVIPQPLGSYFSLLFDNDGTVKEEDLLSGKSGVLDIGYYTTDLLTLDELELIEKQMDSFENGVSTALEAISKDIEDQHGARLDLFAVEEAIKTGKIRLYGEETDIKPIINKRLSELSAEVAARAKTVWKSAADCDRVVLTGGGAALLNGRLNLYRHAQLVPEAQFANALGYFRFGERIANENNN